MTFLHEFYVISQDDPSFCHNISNQTKVHTKMRCINQAAGDDFFSPAATITSRPSPVDHQKMVEFWEFWGAIHYWVDHSLPSGYVKIAIENGPFIVDFPIENGDFP